MSAIARLSSRAARALLLAGLLVATAAPLQAEVARTAAPAADAPLIPATDFPDEKVEQFGQDTPLGRAGQPAELAGAYVYLASEEASYVSGAVVPVTGGRGF
jgi:NAD(P)-dependent dehydrogenase (short-subunit alcohol dehydrogenase family)